MKRTNNKEEASGRKTFHLAVIFALMVFVIMLATSFFVIGGMFILEQFNLIDGTAIIQMPLFLFAVVSLVVGTVIAFIASRRSLTPLQEIMDATDQIAKGDYSVRVQPQGIEDFRHLGEKFNNMAQELGSVEMLRSDFVNNFSHEFKTPIVSIRGFAKALKWEDLTAEEKNEYLDIIISETERLAELSNNVLYLSKIEKQTIVTNIARINVSEQIRLVIALLYEKISAKRINIVFECEEKYINVNEELLKQVWINLLDNAVKFSPEGGKIEIRIAETENIFTVTVQDEGPGMSEETQKHIFDKFYQGERSRTVSGNGLGLAIVKRIVDLHGGNVKAFSDGKSGSVFSVELKK